MLRFLFLLPLLAVVMACSPSGEDLDEPPVPLGDFKLGHNVVVSPKAVRGPLSRGATEAELNAALQKAIDERFGRYEGDRLYHLGVSVEGYVLAAPGVPLVVSPKSIMIIRVTVWDDAASKKLNEEPEQIMVFESLTGETAIGSGLTQSKEQQLRNLAVNAVKQIEVFLLRKKEEDGWFQSAPQDGETTGTDGETASLSPAVIVAE